MALMIRKIDALLGLRRAALPARLGTGQHANQTQQEKPHQPRHHSGQVCLVHGTSTPPMRAAIVPAREVR